jgi:hypothetical protein
MRPTILLRLPGGVNNSASVYSSVVGAFAYEATTVPGGVRNSASGNYSAVSAAQIMRPTIRRGYRRCQ